MPMARGYEFTEPTGASARTTYRTDALKSTHRVKSTDIPIADSCRGPGHAIGSLAFESAIDELAYKCSIDPLALTELVTKSGDAHLECDGEVEPGDDHGNYSQHSYGAQFAEVHVDRDFPITLDKILEHLPE